MTQSQITLSDVEKLINEYFLNSEKDYTEVAPKRIKGQYPNTLIVTEDQYLTLIKELFKIAGDVNPEVIKQVKITSILGLKVIFAEYIEHPRVLNIK
jgi:hypothetical protein